MSAGVDFGMVGGQWNLNIPIERLGDHEVRPNFENGTTDKRKSSSCLAEGCRVQRGPKDREPNQESCKFESILPLEDEGREA